ncbi:MAG: hypothetical protein NZV14_08250 [Bryobacteraceae bacterium]|nr:hypothetical protein [Bryobacteraceae bacterium]MDW8378139.1 hypothetical protein [Bryobacterales bacterium]
MNRTVPLDKKALVEKLARQAHLSDAAAADALDRFIEGVLQDLRRKSKTPVLAPAPLTLPGKSRRTATRTSPKTASPRGRKQPTGV